VIIKTSLPGLKLEDAQISVNAAVLTLRSEFKVETDQNEKTYHLRENRYRAFERQVMLPIDVQTENAKADFETYVLTISLPKADTGDLKQSA
jgi:HSP20 family protein